MSNTYKFVWTDELALEFLNFRIKYAAGFPHETVLKHFKQSKEQVEEKRIEVRDLKIVGGNVYGIILSKEIPPEKYEAVKQAIERELNGENANPAPQTPEPKEEPKPLLITDDNVKLFKEEDLYWRVYDDFSYGQFMVKDKASYSTEATFISEELASAYVQLRKNKVNIRIS